MPFTETTHSEQLVPRLGFSGAKPRRLYLKLKLILVHPSHEPFNRPHFLPLENRFKWKSKGKMEKPRQKPTENHPEMHDTRSPSVLIPSSPPALETQGRSCCRSSPAPGVAARGTEEQFLPSSLPPTLEGCECETPLWEVTKPCAQADWTKIFFGSVKTRTIAVGKAIGLSSCTTPYSFPHRAAGQMALGMQSLAP